MRRDIMETNERGRVELRGLVDSDGIDWLNAEERIANARGFTKNRMFRKVANIDPEELNALRLNGDIDAVAFGESGGTDRRALRNLLRRFPQWRCSEGGV